MARGIDNNTLVVGGIVLGLLGLGYYYSKPAGERAKPGDRVLVGYNLQGVQVQTRLLVSSATDQNLTGTLIDQPGNPPVTVPRSNVVKFA